MPVLIFSRRWQSSGLPPAMGDNEERYQIKNPKGMKFRVFSGGNGISLTAGPFE